MAVTRVWIEEGCISWRYSVWNCPEVFEVKTQGAIVKEGIKYSGLDEKIKDAANACPVQVIMYDETWIETLISYLWKSGCLSRQLFL